MAATGLGDVRSHTHTTKYGSRPLPPNLAATGSRFCTQIVKTLNPQLVNHHHTIGERPTSQNPEASKEQHAPPPNTFLDE
jgi:hypothetical protein